MHNASISRSMATSHAHVYKLFRLTDMTKGIYHDLLPFKTGLESSTGRETNAIWLYVSHPTPQGA
jgi:hypothetical protein